MENVMMRFCRESRKYPASKVARALGLTVKEYREFENGQKLITPADAGKLGKLYRVKWEYFYQSALLLEQLRSQAEIINVLKDKVS
jgi:transcriptional regulator with XRE-family HTH domain